MGLVLATTAALVIWIVLWSLGYSGLDSGLLALVVIVLGAAGNVAQRDPPGGGEGRPGRGQDDVWNLVCAITERQPGSLVRLLSCSPDAVAAPRCGSNRTRPRR